MFQVICSSFSHQMEDTSLWRMSAMLKVIREFERVWENVANLRVLLKHNKSA